ncbi:MAG: lytic transglycosylase domain-containing protein [Saccharospirillaceae bacterium]|nr:lytic transglycosylase domain-containing protein [Pseudomonadales bacterium]NRB77935.1 lytic transglycosylase domain-containing protein [Saccharospirillaceae bacterium]
MLRLIPLYLKKQIFVSAFFFLCLSFSFASDTIDVDQDLLNALKQTNLDSSEDVKFNAFLWLNIMDHNIKKYFPDEKKRQQFLKLVYQEASTAGLPPELVLAVIHTESGFKRTALSRAGALGYMQIMHFWLEELDRPDDNLFNTQTNLRFGCTILAHYLKIEKGNLNRALGRYNGSLGRMKYPNKVLNYWRHYWYYGEFDKLKY